MDTLHQVREYGRPEIFNLIELLLCRIRGRSSRRTVKHEDIYIRDYALLSALTRGLEAYFRFYNHERYHPSLDYAVPAAVRFAVKEQVLGAC